LCFSKGLGAPIGSIITGSEKFIKRARWIRKSIGGGLRQAGVVAAPAHVAVQETFLGGKLAKSHENAKRIERIWTEFGGKTAYPVDTNMVWLDLNAHGIGLDEWIKKGEEYGLRIRGGRLVVHYQVTEESVERLRQLFKEVLKGEVGEAKKSKADIDPADMKLKDLPRTEEEVCRQP
jgi:threonine aldolase